jgi:hypothetical protein
MLHSLPAVGHLRGAEVASRLGLLVSTSVVLQLLWGEVGFESSLLACAADGCHWQDPMVQWRRVITGSPEAGSISATLLLLSPEGMLALPRPSLSRPLGSRLLTNLKRWAKLGEDLHLLEVAAGQALHVREGDRQVGGQVLDDLGAPGDPKLRIRTARSESVGGTGIVLHRTGRPFRVFIEGAGRAVGQGRFG